MKILLAASEVAPLIKLGGLGDVIGSLPKALEKIGVNVDVIVPFFPTANTTGAQLYKSLDITVPYGGESYEVGVYKTKLPNSNVDVLLLQNPAFDIGGKSAYANNFSETEMFGFFDRAVVEYIKTEFNTYDLVHCNDWHTGLITHLLSNELGLERPATLFTIHNLLYRGIGGQTLLKNIGIYPGEHRVVDWDLADDGDVSFILQGIVSSDYVNAVSQSYANEIKTEEFGKDLYDVIITREGRVCGILNGIDYTQFPRNYDIHTVLDIKKYDKSNLQEKLGLAKSTAPLFSFVSRLDPNQKGLDILYPAIKEILNKGGQFVLLGNGNKEWEDKFKELAESFGNKNSIVSMNFVFDTALANEIYAASDFVLIPSKYEPCGLVQMIAMWYGAIPIANAVGGLKDSIKDGITGYLFDSYSSGRLIDAICRAFSSYPTKGHSIMLQNAMREDFSWSKSAKEYKDLYKKVIELKG